LAQQLSECVFLWVMWHLRPFIEQVPTWYQDLSQHCIEIICRPQSSGLVWLARRFSAACIHINLGCGRYCQQYPSLKFIISRTRQAEWSHRRILPNEWY
jgi:hypothetical protein